MRTHNLAFVDIETTGLESAKHEIIEIGCVITTNDLEIIEEFEIKIKPKNIEKADPVSLKINHYNEKDWVDAVSVEEGISSFIQKVDGCIMVGHNVSFDSAFIEKALFNMGMKNRMHYHRIDTISMAWAKLSKVEEVEHFSLHELSTRFGIKNEKSHTALSDARATYLLYKKLMEL